jgi:hypothetical protein
MTWKRTPVASPGAIARNLPVAIWPVAGLAPLLLLVRERQLALGRKKENQPAEQKGHTTDYHRNANRIHFESYVAAVSKIAKVEFEIATRSFWRAISCLCEAVPH